MRNFIISLIMTSLLSISVSAERYRHYEFEKPETIEEALTSIEGGMKDVAQLLEKKDAGTKELAKVHELTYLLEVAVERLREEESSVKNLADAVEELHHASEKGELNKAKQYQQQIARLFNEYTSIQGKDIQ